jgi:hypothetical protein
MKSSSVSSREELADFIDSLREDLAARAFSA